MFLVLFVLAAAQLAGAQGITAAADEEGKIFLTDRNGEKWRCFATGTGSLPLQCRKAGPEDGEPDQIDVEEIHSHFIEDKDGRKYPVRY